MRWPWKKNLATEGNPPREAPRQIEFRPDDNMFQRAENIWAALGFVNDRFGAVPQIAGYLSMYRDWDKQQEARGLPFAPPES